MYFFEKVICGWASRRCKKINTTKLFSNAFLFSKIFFSYFFPSFTWLSYQDLDEALENSRAFKGGQEQDQEQEQEQEQEKEQGRSSSGKK